jgi:hypothetical protein
MTPDPAHVASRTRLDPVCQHRDASGYCRRLSTTAVVAASGDPTHLADNRARCGRHASPDAPRYTQTTGGTE